MNTCASILRKYRTCQRGDGDHWDCRLVCADGTSWSSDEGKEEVEDPIVWDTAMDGLFFSNPSDGKPGDKRKPRRRMNRSMKRRLRDHRRSYGMKMLPEQFDRVLVDAECTHDGSVQHLLK